MTASRAVSSQGTKFYIQQMGGTSAPVTITGITAEASAVVTAAAHGLETGDVVTISGVVGMTEINGLDGVVKVLTTDSFALVNIDSTDFTAYDSGGAAAPLPFIQTCQHRSYSGFDGQASEIDTTTLCSTAKEKVLGLQDFGGMSADLHYVEDDPFQIEATISKRDGLARWFRLTKRNGYHKLYKGYVRSFSDSGAVDGTNTGTMSVTITGEVYEVI